MDTDLHTLLHELREEGQRNDEQEQDRSNKMLNLEPDTARFLSMLIRSSHRKRLLEIGTSNGYSTIWLAWATRAVGGHVTSIDRDERKQVLAEKNLNRAHLQQYVTLLCGDATELVAQLSGPFDCLFFDADRVSAPAQLHLLVPKLTDDALILADNVHLSRPEYWRFMKLFGEALEKRASLGYTFRRKYAERSQGNAYHPFTSITRWA